MIAPHCVQWSCTFSRSLPFPCQAMISPEWSIVMADSSISAAFVASLVVVLGVEMMLLVRVFSRGIFCLCLVVSSFLFIRLSRGNIFTEHNLQNAFVPFEDGVNHVYVVCREVR
ncbi:hypothetical protein EGW08_011055 [Elysia chlorotica]|uniref:Uncharacterized protein n=1 Tax=Elysia chlorotica TaxID=188477 RepID=A0A3S1B6U9_ELYCH|nr:hypothetical protein EGW08_011055 [Elysia chlorotica]